MDTGNSSDDDLRPEYQEIYRGLYEDYGSPALKFYAFRQEAPRGETPESRAVGDIKSAIDNACDRLELSARVRPDARYFLAVNAHELLVKPLNIAQPDQYRATIDRLSGDIETILRTADEISTPSAGPGAARTISSHAVVRALSQSWPHLALMSVGVWS